MDSFPQRRSPLRWSTPCSRSFILFRVSLFHWSPLVCVTLLRIICALHFPSVSLFVPVSGRLFFSRVFLRQCDYDKIVGRVERESAPFLTTLIMTSPKEYVYVRILVRDLSPRKQNNGI
jgi:hypothetical protein